MKKLLVLTLLLFLIPVSAQAHSGLVSSNPSEGETVEEALTDIQLEFDLPIQLGNLKVTSQTGEEISVQEAQAEGQMLSGLLEEELASGFYEVTWDVISQDGHKVEGVISFEVAEREEATEESMVEGEPEAEEPVETELTDTATSQSEVAAQQEAPGGFSMLTLLLVAVLIVAVILIVVVVRRR